MSIIVEQKQRSSWVKYFIINGDNLIGFIYENEKYGTSLVFEKENINLNERLIMCDKSGNTVADIDLLEYFQSIILNNK